MSYSFCHWSSSLLNKIWRHKSIISWNILKTKGKHFYWVSCKQSTDWIRRKTNEISVESVNSLNSRQFLLLILEKQEWMVQMMILKRSSNTYRKFTRWNGTTEPWCWAESKGYEKVGKRKWMPFNNPPVVSAKKRL